MSSNETAQQQIPRPEHRKHPCVLCQQRKVKCDRNEPCRNCTKAGVECISAATLPPRKRKRRFPEAELLARIRRYEHHLKAYGADLDAINNESSIGNSPTGPRAFAPEPDADTIDHGRSLSVRRSLRHVDSNLNAGVSPEFRDVEDLLQGSSDDEMFANPLTKAYDGMYDELGEEGDLLLATITRENTKNLHPSPVHIFRLWQTFLDNVNPLIKIFHAPTVQQKVLDAADDLDNVPKSTEALLFSIYATAVMSIYDADCQKLFGEDKSVVLARFQSGCRLALRNAGYLKSSDIVVLQAFTLYLLSSLQTRTMDPRSLFCLSGCVVRIAQRMGLSTDGTNYAIPPFEVEMRRRLWWQIVLIDIRAAELSGAGPAMLMYTWNTKLPSNINDSDLFPDMREPPVERPGITEMIFVRVRCEGVQLVQQTRARTGCYVLKDDVINDLEQRIEQEYLKYCDPLIPLHLLALMTARTSLCKLRISFRRPLFALNEKNWSAGEKDTLFKLSLKMVEYHNALMKNPSVRRMKWFLYAHFPFPSHLYLLCALRDRTSDEFADKAWHEIEETAELRKKESADAAFFAKWKNNFIHLALGNMTIKAWEAREAAHQNSSQALPVPRFISEYRNMLAEKRAQKSETSGSSPSTLVDQPFEGQMVSQYSMLDSSAPGIDQAPGRSVPPGTDPWSIESRLFQYPNLPTTLPPTGWEFWNDTMQAADQMQGIYTIPPPYNYFPNSAA